LPQTFGRSELVTIPRDDLSGISVVTEKKEDSDGVSWVHSVTVQWRDASGGTNQAKLIELAKEAAEDLASTIRHAVLDQHGRIGR
jgi:hypothetical protein